MRKQSISYDLVFKVLCSVTSKAGSRGLALLDSLLWLQVNNIRDFFLTAVKFWSLFLEGFSVVHCAKLKCTVYSDFWIIYYLASSKIKLPILLTVHVFIGYISFYSSVGNMLQWDEMLKCNILIFCLFLVQESAAEIFSNVRFPLLSAEFLMDRVATEEIMRNNRACR